MFINPKVAIDQKWITGDIDFSKAMQPNAIDFDFDVAYKVKEATTPFFLNGDNKSHLSMEKLAPITVAGPWGEEEYFELAPHTVTDFASSLHVTLPAGVCALLIIRSTLNRNGIFLTSGLYDQGFSGTVAGMLHNRSNTPAYIAPKSRIGQIMFFRAEDSGVLYAGGYNTQQGQHWTEGQQPGLAQQMERATTIGADQTGPTAGKQSFI